MRSSGEIPAAATTPSFKAFNNPSRFSLGRPEMKVTSKIIRSSEYLRPRNERVQELASRQDVNDLEEVVRRNAQRAHQSILNRRRHLAETSLVVLSFEDVDLGDRHLHVLSKARLHPTRCWPGRRRGQQAQIRSPRPL